MGSSLLTIDGSLGEGGGQILRSSLALSLVTRRPFRIFNIRAARRKPGLARQHLTAVLAAAEIGDAELEGAALGSRDLVFAPRALRPGDYRFSSGTAGSTTLILQTVLPALVTARSPSTLVIEGGTHNPHAPPFDFIDRVFLPLLRRMGGRVTATLERFGFYPAGGGRIRVSIEAAEHLSPLELFQRGRVLRKRARALLSNLPRHIGEREVRTAIETLGWPEASGEVVEVQDATGPGNAFLLELESEHATEIATAFGERGVRAEAVATRAAGEIERYLATDAPIGEHLADQLILPLALAGGGAFRTSSVSLHTTTNIEVVQRFIDVEVRAEKEKEDAGAWRITVGSGGHSGIAHHR